MPHKHRPYTAEELESALDEGNVTLERLAATLAGFLGNKAGRDADRGVPFPKPAKHEPVHGAKR